MQINKYVSLYNIIKKQDKTWTKRGANNALQNVKNFQYLEEKITGTS